MPLLVSVGEGDLDKRVEEEEDEDVDEDDYEDEEEDEDEDEEYKKAQQHSGRQHASGGGRLSMGFPLASGQRVEEPVPHRPLVTDPLFRPGPEVDVQAELARVVASQGGIPPPQPEEKEGERGSRLGSRAGRSSRGSQSVRMPGLRATARRGRTRGEVFSSASLGHEVTIRGTIHESGSSQ